MFFVFFLFPFFHHRLTSTGSKYNDRHPNDETYGLPIIEVQPLEEARCFVDPNLLVIEMGLRDPFVPETTSSTVARTSTMKATRWSSNARCPIVWGTPLDLTLKKGTVAVTKETKQYNRLQLIEVEVQGMYDAGYVFKN